MIYRLSSYGENDTYCLHTAGVTGSSPVSPTISVLMTKSVPGIILSARSHPPDLFNSLYYCSMCRKNRATGSSPMFLSKQAMMSSGKMKNRFFKKTGCSDYS